MDVVELQGTTILPQFRLEIPPIIKQNTAYNSPVRSPSAFGESFTNSASRLKSIEVHCNNGHHVEKPSVSNSNHPTLPELHFDRSQASDQDCDGLRRHEFRQYIAREAVLDEEYWVAAWLRAEAHWDSAAYMRRYMDEYKGKYAEKEFYALKKRCFGQDGNSLKCFCLVAVKKETKNIQRNVINSVVGTMDLSIRQYFQGETYPGELKRSRGVLVRADPSGSHKYAYVANVCVSKYKRRQGIASNLLYFAIDIAISSGMKKLYVHVERKNEVAYRLYTKIGFKIVDIASHSKDEKLLMLKELRNYNT